MGIKRTQTSQNNFEKEEQSWRTSATFLRVLLQNYSHQESVVLASRQRKRSMEQDKQSRNRQILIC